MHLFLTDWHIEKWMFIYSQTRSDVVYTDYSTKFINMQYVQLCSTETACCTSALSLVQTSALRHLSDVQTSA